MSGILFAAHKPLQKARATLMPVKEPGPRVVKTVFISSTLRPISARALERTFAIISDGV